MTSSTPASSGPTAPAGDEEEPQPRDIALELPTPELAADLERQSDPRPGDDAGS